VTGFVVHKWQIYPLTYTKRHCHLLI